MRPHGYYQCRRMVIRYDQLQRTRNELNTSTVTMTMHNSFGLSVHHLFLRCSTLLLVIYHNTDNLVILNMVAQVVAIRTNVVTLLSKVRRRTTQCGTTIETSEKTVRKQTRVKQWSGNAYNYETGINEWIIMTNCWWKIWDFKTTAAMEGNRADTFIWHGYISIARFEAMTDNQIQTN